MRVLDRDRRRIGHESASRVVGFDRIQRFEATASLNVAADVHARAADEALAGDPQLELARRQVGAFDVLRSHRRGQAHLLGALTQPAGERIDANVAQRAERSPLKGHRQTMRVLER